MVLFINNRMAGGDISQLLGIETWYSNSSPVIGTILLTIALQEVIFILQLLGIESIGIEN